MANKSIPEANIVDASALGACLKPLLKALGWRGKRRNLEEAMPHISGIYTDAMFCDVLEHLNYKSKRLTLTLNQIDARLLPCLFLNAFGAPYVITRRAGEYFDVFNGEANTHERLKASDERFNSPGEVIVFTANVDSDAEKSLQESWLKKTFRSNRALFWSALSFSFIVNLMMLSTPIYVMNVYDRVVSTGSYAMLFEFVTGIMIILLGIIALHQVRAKLIALLGARLDRSIGERIFERLLYLSPLYTETATVGSQVSRLRDFDQVRQFLAGPLLTTFFDVPYIFVALIIIGILAGNLVIIPIIMIVIFMTFGLSLMMKVRRANRLSGFSNSKQQEFVLETINNMRAVKYLAAEKEWESRYRDMSADSNLASTKVTTLSAVNGALSDSIMIAAGLAVLSFGALKIIAQTMTIGAMIATMILIWRVLAPIKTIFNVLPRVNQMFKSLMQINRLMQIEPETEAYELQQRATKSFKGAIAFTRVSFRYKQAMDPVLMGVTFAVNPGEVVGIVGKNASGKSTVLKLILGLYHPQSGSVLIDNQDIRQLNPIELRNSIAYVPQQPELFYGSIEANLRLGRPEATMDQMISATQSAGIYEQIMALPRQFETSLRDFSYSQLPASFQQGLCLARAYLKRSNILLLDEPAGLLDQELDEYLVKAIHLCRGRITLMMVSHRPSHLKLCDKIMLFEQGQMLLFGTPDEVLPKIPKDFL